MSNNDPLNEQFRRSRLKHKPPSRIKRTIMHYASENQPKSGMQMGAWGALAAAVVTCALLVKVMFYHGELSKPAALETTIAMVEWHGFAPEQVEQQESFLALQQKYFENYRRTMDISTQQEIRTAVLQKVEDDWALLDCNQNLIQISSQLVQELQDKHLLEGQFAVGDNVKLALNKEGYILKIWASYPASC